jgi:iron-sulfur cluster insertion protein
MPDTPQTAAQELRLTESAARRIQALASDEKAEGAMLRISVSGGGCSGFKYGFTFDNQINFDDKVFERDGARLVVDEVSLELLAGSELDFVEDLVGSYFAVRNPNAKSSCGCGTSFSVA